jgi:hypothetical protein
MTDLHVVRHACVDALTIGEAGFLARETKQTRGNDKHATLNLPVFSYLNLFRKI